MSLEKLQYQTQCDLDFIFLSRFDGKGFGRLIFKRVVEYNLYWRKVTTQFWSDIWVSEQPLQVVFIDFFFCLP